MFQDVTLEQVRQARQQLVDAPFAAVDYREMTPCGEETGRWLIDWLTYEAYLAELMRDRMWMGPHGEWAWFNDVLSEALEQAWYSGAVCVNKLILWWNSEHATQVPTIRL